MKSFLFHRETSLTHSLPSREKLPPAPSHKEYLRFPQIVLPEEEVPRTSLHEVLRSRKSAHDFTGADAPRLQDIGALLSLSVRPFVSAPGGNTGRRPYPSGGECYPLEFYLATKDIEGRAGIFHYAPMRHTLEHLFPKDDGMKLFAEIRDGFADPWKDATPAYLLISALWRRTMRKYGELGYRLILFEAGHAAQNILLSASLIGLRHRPTASVDTETFADIINVTDEEETLLYAIALGKEKSAPQKQ